MHKVIDRPKPFVFGGAIVLLFLAVFAGGLWVIIHTLTPGIFGEASAEPHVMGRVVHGDAPQHGRTRQS
jgi:hypothetical protein